MGIYKRPDSPTYWMSMQTQSRRVRLNTGVSDCRLAEELFAAWKAEVARQRWLGKARGETHRTVAELIHEYRLKVSPQKTPESARRDQTILGRLEQQWGSLTTGELTAKMIEDYLAKRRETVCFATVSKELGVLKSAYRHAIRWGWARSNPFDGIPLNQEGAERLRWLTYEEESRLLKACPAWLREMALVGVDTGLRRANLVGLQRQWVHQNGTILIIPKQHIKNKKSAVTIPLTARARAVIGARLTVSTGEALFTRQDGSPYCLASVSTAFARAAQAAGLVHVSLHTLRHTFVSRLVQAGRSLAEVAALAGHRDLRVTLRYAHLAPNQLVDAIKVLEPPQQTAGNAA
jgi:integrase